MSSLLIPGTRVTPEILFEPEKGFLLMKGKSSPENALDFFTPLLDFIPRINTLSRLEILFQIEYFNTSSSKCIFLVFKEFEKLHKSGIEINVNWYADEDDLDLIEIGRDIQDLTGLSFQHYTY